MMMMMMMFLATSALLGYTFDAVDGKQARRTNSTSPLGELFDHGCDALGCALEALAFGSTIMCGRATIWFWVIATIPFFGATWENYFTNVLNLSVINEPTEGLMLIYLCHFFTTFVGAEWWAQQFGRSMPFLSWVPFFNEIPTYQVVLHIMITVGVIPTISFKDYISPSDLVGNYPHRIVLGTGLAFEFLVGRMILSHLCDEPQGLKTSMCMCLLYLPLAIANALTARLNDGVPLVDEFLVLIGYCAYTAFVYLHFAMSVIHEITTALGICCFRITQKRSMKIVNNQFVLLDSIQLWTLYWLYSN